MRRHYSIGQCGDCGRTTRTTLITFWVNGYKMRACSLCIRAYRSVILAACRCASCTE